jgi:hydroxymethylpyrimidine/phosphomethylpyrimidine kinase
MNPPGFGGYFFAFGKRPACVNEKRTESVDSWKGGLCIKNLLTIAGSDCSGGAGIQADLKTFAAHGAYGMSVIVSVVAENTSRVLSVRDLEPDVISSQIDAVFEDIRVDGVKIGMLSGVEQMRAVAQKLRQYRPQGTVLDPVMVAKGGCALMHPEALQTLKEELLPLADVLTPNLPEAEALTGEKIETSEERRRAAEKICRMGAKSVLLKGGHLSGEAEDLLFDGSRFYRFTHRRIATKNTHGTGCTLSSAIAVNLAEGMPLPDAVRAAKEYVTAAIEHALPIGKGHGPTNHFYFMKGIRQ